VDGLVRVVRLGGGSLAVGRESAGRGAWLCRDSPGCIDEAVRKKAFGRALRGRVEPREVEAIRVELGSSPHQLPEPGSESPVL
jgi:predicted RNA-binding protein YlxR (DUF448 family)